MWVQAKVWDHRQGHREGWEETAGRARGCRKTGFIPNINIFTSCPSQPNSGFSSQFHLASSNSNIAGTLSKIQILRLYLGPNDRETPRGGHSNWCFTGGLPGDSEAQQSLRTVEQSGPCLRNLDICTFQDNFCLLQVNLLVGKSSVRITTFSLSFHSVSATAGA